MLDRNGNQNAVIAAALAASLVMGLSGLIYRALAAPVDKIPLDPNALAGFPLQIGPWTGQDSPIDPAIRKAIDADAYINRRYSRQNGLESISLYLPCGTTAPKLLRHIPENCYVGAGWTLVDRRPAELSWGGGRTLRCSLVQFARGGLDVRQLVLLHFLVADGEYFETFWTVAQAKGWRRFADTHYVGQVQIVASADNLSVDAATTLVTDFAREAVPVMQQFFTRLAGTQMARESHGE